MTVLEGYDLWSLVHERAARTPDRCLAVDEHDRRVTFAGFEAMAERAAAGLAGLGVGAGSRVMWMLPTRLEALVLSAALARLGAVQVPLIPVYRQREIGFIARQCQAPWFVIPRHWRGTDYVALARSSVDGMVRPPELVVADPDLPDGDPAALPAARPSQPRELRWIFYTSGTTADPKGARHSDATIAASARGLIAPWRLTDDDCVTLLFPYAHIGGPALLFITLMAGNQLAIAESFDRDRVIEMLVRHGVTLAGSGPAFWRAYIDAQLAHGSEPMFPRLRALIGGGAAKPATMNRDARTVLGADVVSGYGLTECPSLMLNHVGDPDEVLATDGRTMEGAELRTCRADGTVARAGEDGEIQVRGTMLFLGYLDPALDEAAFTADGWLRTGDLGRLDKHGQLTVTGRLKDIIIRKGENISAKEVEDVLIEHPAIRDVAVIGLPDDARGERCCAVIVAADGAPAPSLDDIVEHCLGAGMMRQKIPEQVEVCDGLPYNSMGKVLKAELRQRYASGAR